jgi:hypothetical protein
MMPKYPEGVFGIFFLQMLIITLPQFAICAVSLKTQPEKITQK